MAAVTMLLLVLIVALASCLVNSFSIGFRSAAPTLHRASSTMLFSTAVDSTSAKLFEEFSDSDGFLKRSDLETIPELAEMIEDDDLTVQELDDMWNKVVSKDDSTRINSEGFLKLYKMIDELFEDDEDEGEDEVNAPNDEVAAPEDPELVAIFSTLASNGFVSKAALQQWEEITQLMDDNLLDSSEFETVWNDTPKVDGMIDKAGFLAFNNALDALFDDDEDEEEDEKEEPVAVVPLPPPAQTNRQMVSGEDLPPGVLFASIANEDYTVGMPELKSWIELQEMLAEGDLMESELKEIFKKNAVVGGKVLNEEGFINFFEEIDALFEDDEDERAPVVEEPAIVDEPVPVESETKSDLLSYIDIINDEEGLPCGLECSEQDERQVLKIVNTLEGEPSNLIRARNGNIGMDDIAGSWELLYTSSSAMKFNNGLSGLGGSFPNGKFGGFVQKLENNKYMSDMTYVERINAVPESASFDVTVNGDWDIKTSVSLFTGNPTIVVNVVPNRVTYGPTSTRADHWKSLGPLNMLDMTYLDDDLRIMRGCTASDTLFVYRRVP